MVVGGDQVPAGLASPGGFADGAVDGVEAPRNLRVGWKPHPGRGSPVGNDLRLFSGSLAARHDPRRAGERLQEFTELIATAIANAATRQARAQLAEEQAALRRVATLVAEGAEPEAVFSAVAGEVAHVLDVALSVRSVRDGRCGDPGRLMGVGQGESVSGRYVVEARRGQRLWARRSDGAPRQGGHYAELPGPIAAAVAGDVGVRSAVGAPILVGGDGRHAKRNASTPPTEHPSSRTGHRRY